MQSSKRFSTSSLLFSLSTVTLLFLLGGFYAGCASFGATPEGARLERIQKSEQYGEDGFVNVHPAPESPAFLAVAWEFLTNDEPIEPEKELSIQKRSVSEFTEPPADGLRITWFGHSSILVEIDGSMILIDPVWGDRVSPVSFMGPQRFHENPLSLEELAQLPIDAVVISHDHYDHLDYPTILALKETNTRFLVPLGVGAHLERWGIEPSRIEELDWWDETRVGSIRLVATPAQHFSGRTLGDRDKTLWSSWAILGPKHRVFYSGDTGYFEAFKEIGERLGPFDVSLMAIGAYDDRWAFVHFTPEEALQAHKDVRAKKFVPVHWGTFNLAFHGWTEPAERTLETARKDSIEVWTPRPGQSVSPPMDIATSRWWETLGKLAENSEP
ncbi:MAG TPA: hypothetical protein DEA96_14450 [Leptospiraceae bacterium]|nr:hypothetical protein [Spirochaetaceae bacterium]HBS06165.1 hypothetical protein [Leptospiraceae bacterium]|tara:strand:- start:21011 stop:22165 length:1155 start_codon:yes stop_codon:yes gene_type:complete